MSWSTILPLSLLIASCSNIQSLEKTPMIVAHRGASATAPENTLASFRMGFAEGADRIEGDFRITSDGRVVCIHDETTGRTAGESGSLVVKDTEYSRLNELDVGSWKDPRFKGERIVSLEEVLVEYGDLKNLESVLKMDVKILNSNLVVYLFLKMVVLNGFLLSKALSRRLHNLVIETMQ